MLQYWGGVLKKKFVKFVVQDLTSGGIDWQREKWKSGFGSKFIRQGEKNAVKYPYFEEICKKTNAKWYIGYHSLDDLKRLLSFADKMNLREITVFRS